MFPRGFLGSHDDYCNYNSSGVVLHVGGNYGQNQNHGAFYLNGNNAASNANANVGCRHLADRAPPTRREWRPAWQTNYFSIRPRPAV